MVINGGCISESCHPWFPCKADDSIGDVDLTRRKRGFIPRLFYLTRGFRGGLDETVEGVEHLSDPAISVDESTPDTPKIIKIG